VIIGVILTGLKFCHGALDYKMWTVFRKREKSIRLEGYDL